MTKETRIAFLENRVALLSERQKDNGKIVRKLQRQIRRLKNGWKS